MGNTEQAHCALCVKSVSLTKSKRKVVASNEKIRITIPGNSKIYVKKKKICHLVPEVVIDLPFEESRKSRKREC